MLKRTRNKFNLQTEVDLRHRYPELVTDLAGTTVRAYKKSCAKLTRRSVDDDVTCFVGVRHDANVRYRFGTLPFRLRQQVVIKVCSVHQRKDATGCLPCVFATALGVKVAW